MSEEYRFRRYYDKRQLIKNIKGQQLLLTDALNNDNIYVKGVLDGINVALQVIYEEGMYYFDVKSQKTYEEASVDIEG